LSIIEELVLNGKPDLTNYPAMVTKGRLEVDGEGIEEPSGSGRGSGANGDVVSKGEVLKRQPDKVPPMGVLCGLDAEGDGH
jgi:hypothetical protein